MSTPNRTRRKQTERKDELSTSTSRFPGWRNRIDGNLVVQVLVALAAVATITTFVLDNFIGIFAHDPDISASHIVISLNGGPRQTVSYEDILEVKDGDSLEILELWFFSPSDGIRTDIVAAEVYIRSASGKFGNGRFAIGVPIAAGMHKIDGFFGKGTSDEWTLTVGMDKVSVALIHYRACWNSEGCHEVDDRFFFNIRYR